MSDDLDRLVAHAEARYEAYLRAVGDTDNIGGFTPGFTPSVYPACVVCSRAWALHRDKGVWAWYPDCVHKRAKCKLVES